MFFWSIRMMPNRAPDETPFTLVHKVEEIVPMELKYGSSSVHSFNKSHQERLRHNDATLVEEDHLQAALGTARYQHALRGYHRRKVHERIVEDGDLVLRCI